MPLRRVEQLQARHQAGLKVFGGKGVEIGAHRRRAGGRCWRRLDLLRGRGGCRFRDHQRLIGKKLIATKQALQEYLTASR